MTLAVLWTFCTFPLPTAFHFAFLLGAADHLDSPDLDVLWTLPLWVWLVHLHLSHTPQDIPGLHARSCAVALLQLFAYIWFTFLGRAHRLLCSFGQDTGSLDKTFAYYTFLKLNMRCFTFLLHSVATGSRTAFPLWFASFLLFWTLFICGSTLSFHIFTHCGLSDTWFVFYRQVSLDTARAGNGSRYPFHVSPVVRHTALDGFSRSHTAVHTVVLSSGALFFSRLVHTYATDLTHMVSFFSRFSWDHCAYSAHLTGLPESPGLRFLSLSFHGSAMDCADTRFLPPAGCTPVWRSFAHILRAGRSHHHVLPSPLFLPPHAPHVPFGLHSFGHHADATHASRSATPRSSGLHAGLPVCLQFLAHWRLDTFPPPVPFSRIATLAATNVFRIAADKHLAWNLTPVYSHWTHSLLHRTRNSPPGHLTLG